MPNFCAAPNCTRKSTQSDLAFFRFPRDPIRCQKWVENCRRYDLEDKTPDQLNKHYRLCAQHFEDIMICRSSPYRTVLRENAIPTIFDLTSHLDNPGRRRKRIKELSEDEIQMLKERKRTEVVFGLHHSVLMGSKSFLDIELLIALVRLHPELYDPLHCSYNDSGRSGELWNQISSEIFMDWDDLNPQQRSMKVQEVQTKWQSLKENFRQELYEQMMQEFTHPGVEKSVFPHFQELLFLKPVMVHNENTVQRPRTDNGSDEGHVQIVYIKEEPPDSPGSPEAYGPSPSMSDHQYHKKGSGHSIEGLRTKEEQDDEEHVDFDFEGLRTKEEQDENHVDFEGLKPKEQDDEEHVDFDFEGLRTKEEQDENHVDFEGLKTKEEQDDDHVDFEGLRPKEQDDEEHVNFDFEGLRTKEEQDDDHVDFAQSLVPYLAQVPDSHQGRLRTDLTNLILCYIRNTRGHVPTISPQLMRYVSAQDDPST